MNRGIYSAILAVAMLTLTACSEDQALGPPVSPTRGEPRGKAAAAVAMARGKVEVEGGLIALASAGSGVVKALPVGEGERVKRGQTLLRLDDALADKAIDVATAEVRLWRERMRANEARLPALRTDAARHAAAARQGASSQQLADAAQQRLADAQADVAVAQAELTVASSRLAVAKATQAQCTLAAPEDGTVVRLDTQSGAYLQAGATALTLLPDRPLIVRAELNAAYVDAVKVGMRATVVSDMDGANTATRLPSARVVRISPVYGQGRLQDHAARGPVRVVDCVLVFDSPPQVRVGENVKVIFHE